MAPDSATPARARSIPIGDESCATPATGPVPVFGRVVTAAVVVDGALAPVDAVVAAVSWDET